MIELNKMMLINYCHPDCVPLKNIMRLTKEEAFKMAKELSDAHPETTAFYRFADFENYYKLRVAQDRYLYNEFISIGGEPETDHPLSFVIEGSNYLQEWFGYGIETIIPIAGIDEKHISFTLGDSGAEYGKNGSVKLLRMRDMKELLSDQIGTFADFLNAIGKQYVEAQLWSDKYIKDC